MRYSVNRVVDRREKPSTSTGRQSCIAMLGTFPRHGAPAEYTLHEKAQSTADGTPLPGHNSMTSSPCSFMPQGPRMRTAHYCSCDRPQVCAGLSYTRFRLEHSPSPSHQGRQQKVSEARTHGRTQHHLRRLESVSRRNVTAIKTYISKGKLCSSLLQERGTEVALTRYLT